MSLFLRALFSVGLAILLFSSFPVNAIKNFNSSKSNTSSVNYPINLGDCEAAGGTAMLKGEDGFCIMEINTAGPGTLDHPSPANCISAGGMIETKGGKQYCMPTEQELGSILVAPVLVRNLNIQSPQIAKAVSWTDWLNRDGPGGSGDYETVKDFLSSGQIEPNPVGIECQTTSGADWEDAGQIYTCTIEVGGVCRNNQQAGGQRCLDYQVRFRY